MIPGFWLEAWIEGVAAAFRIWFALLLIQSTFVF